MSQKVTLDDEMMRARLRSFRHVSRPATYTERSVAQPSRQLFQNAKLADVAPLLESHFSQPKLAHSKPLVAASVKSTPKQFSDIRPLKSVDTLAPQTVKKKAVPRQMTTATAHKPESSKVLMREAAIAATKKSVARQSMDGISAAPRAVKQQAPSPSVMQQNVAPEGSPEKRRRFRVRKLSRSTLLTAMAVVVFVVGMGASLMGFHTNNVAQAEVAKVNKKISRSASTTTGGGTTPPSTAPVSGQTLASYTVAPDEARYIRIPKLKVFARVLKVGVTSSGALAVPTNVFDTARYDASAKPGQPGATLIDGHVSSWTTNGVFYGIKNLAAGDAIEIERGDGTKLEYTVVKTTAFPVDGVDMQSLMEPVTPGKSGLNLITCGGKYDSKAGEFTERIAVYATLSN
ncbi:MAG: class F sortase [Candidatus Saccharimonadales bacterium]